MHSSTHGHGAFHLPLIHHQEHFQLSEVLTRFASELNVHSSYCHYNIIAAIPCMRCSTWFWVEIVRLGDSAHRRYRIGFWARSSESLSIPSLDIPSSWALSFLYKCLLYFYSFNTLSRPIDTTPYVVFQVLVIIDLNVTLQLDGPNGQTSCDMRDAIFAGCNSPPSPLSKIPHRVDAIQPLR